MRRKQAVSRRDSREVPGVAGAWLVRAGRGGKDGTGRRGTGRGER